MEFHYKLKHIYNVNVLLILTVWYYAHIHTKHEKTSRKFPTLKSLKILKIINNKGVYSFSILFY